MMDSIVTTAAGLQQSVTSYAITGRTTYCDLMCITTTAVEYNISNGIRNKFGKTLNVSLPYKNQVIL
jgi:hypothetical protein